MKKITLAIPFYNTSQYFLEAVEYALSNDFVEEIVINDDCSLEDEWSKLNEIANNLNTDKVKLFRNEVNIGGFRNKYTAVQNSSCEWVYLLDSDNHPTPDTLGVLESLDELDPNICYCPEKLLLYNNEDGYTNEAVYHFKYETIGLEEAKDGIIKRTKWFDWFLNTGNYFFNREYYLEYMREPFEDQTTELLHADVLAFSYFWFRSGGEFKVVPNFHYHHRLRSASYWNACGSNSSLSAELYKSKILDL
jgi:cellulose synthase/poly-beta-1,6-N-acetylglucosamine synthase-like glycosyltransferase